MVIMVKIPKNFAADDSHNAALLVKAVTGPAYYIHMYILSRSRLEEIVDQIIKRVILLHTLAIYQMKILICVRA